MISLNKKKQKKWKILKNIQIKNEKKNCRPIAKLENFLKVDAALVDTVNDVLVDPIQDQRNYAHHGRL